MSFRNALGWATITTFAGSCFAIFFANALLLKFSGKGIAPAEMVQSMPFMIAVAGGAGLTVILASLLGFPISTTHAIFGALIGSALLASSGNINFKPLLPQFIIPLLISPFFSLVLAYLLFQLLKRLLPIKIQEQSACICLEEQKELAPMYNSQTKLLPIPTMEININNLKNCEMRNAQIIFGFKTKKIFDTIHILSAGAVCFARGLNDTPKIIALLLISPILNLQWSFLMVGVAMLVGGLISAKKVAETMSLKITKMNPLQGLSANLTTAGLVIFASTIGVPVSTTHVSVGALFGIGVNNKETNKGLISLIALSWVLTLPCAALCSSLLYLILAKI